MGQGRWQMVKLSNKEVISLAVFAVYGGYVHGFKYFWKEIKWLWNAINET